jgi:hypothetical protein
VLSGIQQTYPASDSEHLGLLPDSFNLRAQTRHLANINAATVLVPAIPALGERLLYDYRVLPRQGPVVHAPGALTDISERDGEASFTVLGWPASPYFVLVNRLRQRPQVSVGGQPLRLEPPHHWSESDGALVLRLSGTSTVRLSGLPPQTPGR